MRRCSMRSRLLVCTNPKRLTTRATWVSTTIPWGVKNLHKPQAVDHPCHVGIHDNPLGREELAQHHISGLAPHPWQAHQLLQRLRDLAPEALQQRLAASPNRPCFCLVIARRVDIALELLDGNPQVVLRRAVLAEELLGDLVDALVGALCREDRGNEQLKRRGEAQANPRCWVCLTQPLHYLAHALPFRHGAVSARREPLCVHRESAMVRS